MDDFFVDLNETRCHCGNIYVPDALYCRACGSLRSDKKAEDAKKEGWTHSTDWELQRQEILKMKTMLVLMKKSIESGNPFGWGQSNAA